jgi:hypothetical protein
MPELQIFFQDKPAPTPPATKVGAGVSEQTAANVLKPGSLRRVKIFADFQDEQLERFVQYMEVVRVCQWTEIVKQGDDGDAMYLVLQGELRVRMMIAGKETLLVTLAAGEFFGEISLFDHGPRSADVVANQDSLLLKISAAGFDKLQSGAPDLAAPFLFAICKTLTARIRADNKRYPDSISFARTSTPGGSGQSPVENVERTGGGIPLPELVGAVKTVGLKLDESAASRPRRIVLLDERAGGGIAGEGEGGGGTRGHGELRMSGGEPFDPQICTREANETAMALFKARERISRELGNKAGLQASLGDQAMILANKGELAAALKLYSEQERLCRELGSGEDLVMCLRNQEWIEVSTGRSVVDYVGYCSPERYTEAPQPTDSVQCTVFAPPSVSLSETFVVQVFAHLTKDAEEARKLAKEFDEDAQRRAFKNLETKIKRLTKLTFELRMPGLQIDDTVQSLVWSGKPEAVQFSVTTPKDHASGNVVGTVTISQDSIPIGHIKFKLKMIPATVAPPHLPEPVGDDARHYHMAFVSYASKDREKVLPRVQMLKALGIHYFQDIIDLDPGDRWERKLYLYIDTCDLFLLFWSSAAKESQWVRKEAQHALARKVGDESAPPEIRPIIIEGPPVPPPWDELAHLHFNDRMIHFIQGA